jgi:hypothetical protein
MSAIPENRPATLQDLEGNYLLALLTREGRQRLLPLMRLVSLEAKQVIYEAHSGIRTIYFPLGAACDSDSRQFLCMPQKSR